MSMPSFETPAQPPLKKEELTLKDKAKKWGSRLAVAAALSGPMAGQAADVSEKAAEPAKVERVQKAENREQTAARLEEAREFMKKRLNDLGILSGPAFIDNVKKNSGSIRAFLENPEVPTQFPGPLGEIVKKYAGPLAEAKKSAPDLYKENVFLFQKAVDIAETKPLTQIKNEMIALFGS